MDNFKTIYQILKTLEKALDLEEIPKDLLTAGRFAISEPRFARILEMLVSDGYIKGIEIWNSLDQDYPRYSISRPGITVKGLEYLAENSVMKKLAKAAKGIADIIP